MNPIDFPEKNFTFTKPEGWTDEECSPLPVYKAPDIIISCWELSDDEKREIAETGKVYLWMHVNYQVPVSLHVFSPFDPSLLCYFCRKPLRDVVDVIDDENNPDFKFCSFKCREKERVDNYEKQQKIRELEAAPVVTPLQLETNLCSECGVDIIKNFGHLYSCSKYEPRDTQIWKEVITEEKIKQS